MRKRWIALLLCLLLPLNAALATTLPRSGVNRGTASRITQEYFATSIQAEPTTQDLWFTLRVPVGGTMIISVNNPLTSNPLSLRVIEGDKELAVTRCDRGETPRISLEVQKDQKLFLCFLNLMSRSAKPAFSVCFEGMHGERAAQTVIPATCTEDGEQAVACALCGTALERKVIPAAHTPGSGRPCARLPARRTA